MSPTIAAQRHGACAGCAALGQIAWHDGPCPQTAEGTGTPSPVPSVPPAGCAACAVVGPLLTGPESSGRTWICETCDTAWTAS